MTTTIKLPSNSRYLNTRVGVTEHKTTIDGVTTTENKIFLGTWRPPSITLTKPEILYRVSPDELNRPDLIAHRIYGDSNLFWPIALRNAIYFPLRDITVGQILYAPDRDDVMAALNISSDLVTGRL